MILCGVAVMIPLAFVAEAHVKAQYLMDKSGNSVDKFVNRLADVFAVRLVGRSLKASSLHKAALDKTMLGKPGHIASPSLRSLITPLPLHASSPERRIVNRAMRAPISRLAWRTRKRLLQYVPRAGTTLDVAMLNNSNVQTMRALEARRSQLLAELADVNRAMEAEAAQSKELPMKIGSRKSVFEPSFGYLSKSAGVYTDVQSADGFNIPSNALDLAIRNFRRELPEFLKTLSGNKQVQSPDSEEAAAFRAKLDKLVLDNDGVWAREKLRPAVQAPLILLIPYYVLCWCLDVAFDKRPLARFWFLETVARMPYFSYVSSLHLYETLGWWRRSAESKRVHFAEEWNEFHHLLTMEALGGDQLWQDRFLAQHAAVTYYFVLVGLWLLSPSLSYKFSELIEAHAVDTYGEFVDANRELLAELPAPRVSRLYWNGPDLFLFDEFQTSRPRGSRRPPCETLLDVFTNIRDDEAEHVATMAACQNPDVAVTVPRIEAALLTTAAVGAAALGLMNGDGSGISDIQDIVEGASDVTDVIDVITGGAGGTEVAAGLAAVAAVAQQLFSDIIANAGTAVEDFSLGELFEKVLERFDGDS